MALPTARPLGMGWGTSSAAVCAGRDEAGLAGLVGRGRDGGGEGVVCVRACLWVCMHACV